VGKTFEHRRLHLLTELLHVNAKQALLGPLVGDEL
jgi:hypothetical protein